MFCVFLRYDSDDVACQPFGSSLRLCVQWERNEKHSNHMKLTDFWLTSMAWIGCQRRASARSPGEKPPEQGQVKAPRQQPSKTHCMSLTFNFAFERIRCSNALLGHSLLTILSFLQSLLSNSFGHQHETYRRYIGGHGAWGSVVCKKRR